MVKHCFNLFLLLLFPFFYLSAQNQEPPSEKAQRMAWFEEAKLGIFIHWGIYAVNGIDESWSFYNRYLPYEEYMKQLDGFTAQNYDPQAWARLIKESGAKYAVLTTKHHDGVALWDTQMSDLNVVDRTPAGRDLVTPFCDALRKEDLKVGLYYSLLDWSHPDYDHFISGKKRYDQDEDRWASFMKFNMGQLEEILQQFDPDLYWFDGDWDHSAEEWNAKSIREMLLKQNPKAILNSRLQGYGDYATPEQGLPVLRPKSKYWELCMTINDSWGYQPQDQEYKTPSQVLRIFIECISMGGNLLLDIGPKEDGTIPEKQVQVLKELGRWTAKHQEAVYGTKAGIPHGHFYGPTALSRDSTTLYLYLVNPPKGQVLVKGLKNKVNRVWVVGNGTKVSYKVMGKAYWSAVPGLLYIDVPEEVQDEEVTVLALLLDGKVDLHRE
jgi:alpha-L-fucosidase